MKVSYDRLIFSLVVLELVRDDHMSFAKYLFGHLG